MAKRKLANRSHIVYELVVGDHSYIGVTVVENRSPKKSLARRWRKHVQRAYAENRGWKLCDAIRSYGPDAFEMTILAVHKNKASAHDMERDMIREYCPDLNTDVR